MPAGACAIDTISYLAHEGRIVAKLDIENSEQVLVYGDSSHRV